MDGAVRMGEAVAAVEFILRDVCRRNVLITAICRSTADLAVRAGLFPGAPLHKAGTKIISEEGQEESSHEDSRCCTFVLELA